MSTSKAEYIAMSEICKEDLWLDWLGENLGIKFDMPILHFDRWSANRLAKNLVLYAKTKHVDVKYHFIRGQPNTASQGSYHRESC